MKNKLSCFVSVAVFMAASMLLMTATAEVYYYSGYNWHYEVKMDGTARIFNSTAASPSGAPAFLQRQKKSWRYRPSLAAIRLPA